MISCGNLKSILNKLFGEKILKIFVNVNYKISSEVYNSIFTLNYFYKLLGDYMLNLLYGAFPANSTT